MQATHSCSRRPRILPPLRSLTRADHSEWYSWRCDRRPTVTFINRYYDPATAQFVSVDPDLAQTDQAYVYAGDDPVNNSDPSGLCNSQGDGNAWDLFNPWSINDLIRCSVQKNPNSVTTQILEANPAYQAIQYGYDAYSLAQNPCSSTAVKFSGKH